jgi:phosphatidylglycerol:prolipoprotein diacylglycerol transferase
VIDLLGLKIHFYGLFIGVGIWAAMEVAQAREKTKEGKHLIDQVFWWAVIGGIVGARAYHVIDFWERYYVLNPIKVFYAWEGGLGIWGGIVGGTLAVYVFCRLHKQSYPEMLDKIVVGVPLAQAIGRLGNWVNGELVGKNGEPLFAFEAFLNLMIFGMLWQSAKKENNPGFLTGMYLAGYGMARIFLERMRPDEIIWKVGGVPVAIIFSILALVVGFLLKKEKKERQ